MTDMERLEKDLRSFDWWYSMSDDHGVWIAGEQQHQALRSRALNLGREGFDLYTRIRKEVMES